MEDIKDLIIIGGGQSALACAYFLRRTDVEYLILDNQEQCGGAWLHTWDSLTLFSPAEYSSLPGWFMPKTEGKFPSREEVINYLCKYEERYEIPVERPVSVKKVTKEDDLFVLLTDKGEFRSRAVISATGTWGKPFVPDVPGSDNFNGEQVHSAHYKNPENYRGKKVLVVGEGNSGAQLLAELSKVTLTEWAVREDPDFLPPDVDGRVLFNVASAKYHAEQKGEKFDASKYNLGNIVQVPPVKEALERNALQSKGSLKEIIANGIVWDTGEKEEFDVIIWCTGFGYATHHLKELVSTDKRGKIKTEGTRAVETEGLWLVGYGGCTGYASATLIGVGRTAKETVKEVEGFLAE